MDLVQLKIQKFHHLNVTDSGYNDDFILNCSDHLELLYSNFDIDATVHFDKADNGSQNTEFKKMFIVMENLYHLIIMMLNIKYTMQMLSECKMKTIINLVRIIRS